MESKSSFEFLNYNYLAGEWEPFIEKFHVTLNFSQKLANVDLENKVIYNIEIFAFDSEYSVINVNLSDINVKIIFFYNLDSTFIYLPL